MKGHNGVVGIFSSLTDAESIITKFQRAGFDMKTVRCGKSDAYKDKLNADLLAFLKR